MEEKASVSACVLGSGKGKDKMWGGERERRGSPGEEKREKGFGSFIGCVVLREGGNHQAIISAVGLAADFGAFCSVHPKMNQHMVPHPL